MQILLGFTAVVLVLLAVVVLYIGGAAFVFRVIDRLRGTKVGPRDDSDAAASRS